VERRFVRRSYDKVFGGVCSGLADYIGVEVALVRLLTLVGIIVTGLFPGLLLYFLFVIIVPNDTQAYRNPYTTDYSYDEQKSNHSRPSDSRMLLGVALIALGIFLFARMLFSWIDFKYIFAGILILGGLYLIIRKRE
jgi:phage shock protein PspC (stress-responsive transcriptional regulator)